MTPTFNPAELMDRIDGDVEFLEECIEIFDEDSAPLLAKIREAVAAQDAEALVPPAHTLKGMLSNFCAAPAETAAREIESRGRAGELGDIDAAVDLLQRESEQLRTALQTFLQAKKQ